MSRHELLEFAVVIFAAISAIGLTGLAVMRRQHRAPQAAYWRDGKAELAGGVIVNARLFTADGGKHWTPFHENGQPMRNAAAYVRDSAIAPEPQPQRANVLA